MVLTKTTFDKLIKETPSIEVCLEWDGDEGRSELKDHEIETSEYFLQISLNVFESGTTDHGDHFQPPEFNSDGVTVYQIQFKIFSKISDEEVHLTEDQAAELEKDIISNLQIS